MTWDPPIVLEYLTTYPAVEDLTLQQLVHKSVMLCALVTGQRAQSLHLMNLLTVKEEDSYTFYIDQLVKQSGPSRIQPTLVIPKFPADHRLCVAPVMEEYIKRTASIRGQENPLFLNTIRPFSNVSKSTISRWIKVVMQAAGIDIETFKPHSTRAAATSQAKQCDVSINSILNAARWTTDCVFHRFYNKNVVSPRSDAEFGNAILSASQ